MHGQWWLNFSRSFIGFEFYVLNLQCRLIFLHFYPHLAYQSYHISAITSKIQAPVVWHHPWVLENALKSHVNISLIYPQKWWSMGSRSLCARGGRLITEVCLFMKSDSSDPKRCSQQPSPTYSPTPWSVWHWRPSYRLWSFTAPSEG